MLNQHFNPSEAKLNLESSWSSRLQCEFEKTYMTNLRAYLVQRLKAGQTIYPNPREWFAAMNEIAFDQVKVVILGQDPYHGSGQAHGLSFSVKPGVTFPPSLLNIYKELKNDLGLTIPKSGYLMPWVKQGVLLLNCVLTVEDGSPASHQGQGWETFTDRVIHLLAEERSGIAFVLWGAYAQRKGAFINRQRHLVIESPHPSPLSAHRGFFGSKPFSRINQYLADNSQAPIDWRIY